jgi:hypothetical protein
MTSGIKLGVCLSGLSREPLRALFRNHKYYKIGFEMDVLKCNVLLIQEDTSRITIKILLAYMTGKTIYSTNQFINMIKNKPYSPLVDEPNLPMLHTCLYRFVEKSKLIAERCVKDNLFVLDLQGHNRQFNIILIYYIKYLTEKFKFTEFIDMKSYTTFDFINIFNNKKERYYCNLNGSDLFLRDLDDIKSKVPLLTKKHFCFLNDNKDNTIRILQNSYLNFDLEIHPFVISSQIISLQPDNSNPNDTVLDTFSDLLINSY